MFDIINKILSGRIDNDIKDKERNIFFLAFDSILRCNDNKVLYISTPITTGYRLISWAKDLNKIDSYVEYKHLHEKNVILPNIKEARKKIKQIIINSGSDIIIEPTTVKMNGWNQFDYIYFWAEVINKYVNKVIFLNGWECSNGCCAELLVAILLKLEIATEQGLLTVDKAMRKIQSGITDLNNANQDSSFIKKIYDILVEKPKT